MDLRYLDGGQDLYIRLAMSELGEIKTSKKFPIVAVIAPVASTVILLLIVFAIWWRRRTRILDIIPQSPASAVASLNLPTVKNVTGNFSESNIIGQGGFGIVYKVRLVVKLYVSGAHFRPQRQDHIEKWNGHDIMKWRETTSKNLAVVSTLVATVAFSAAFNVPGSYGPDGKANLSGDRMYNAFLVLDTVAMTTSVMATILLVYGRASRSHRSWLGFMISMHFLWLSLNSMMLAFFAAIAAVMSEKKSMKIALSQLIYYGLYILMTLLTHLATLGSLTGVVRFLVGSCSERQRRAKRRITRQFPFVIFYAFNMVVFIVVNTIVISAVDVTGHLRW